MLITLGYLFSSLMIAILFPEAQIVFGFLGGVCSCVFVVLVPALLRIEVMGESLARWKAVLYKGLFTGIMLCGFTGTIILSAGLAN